MNSRLTTLENFAVKNAVLFFGRRNPTGYGAPEQDRDAQRPGDIRKDRLNTL